MLINLLILEENKGKDHFRAKYFTVFKALFKNYDDTVLLLLCGCVNHRCE